MAGRFFLNEIPQAVRGHLQAVAWSAIIFFMGIALGLSAVQFDERAASIILPNSMLNSIYSGQMWTGSIFSVVPAPVASTFLFTSNISVALLAFAGGLSFGLITTLILFQNGFMLGVAFKLCADYGLLGAMLGFIAAHGLLEISAIIIAGAGGFVVANALLNPGSLSRSDAIAQQGRSAVRMAVACIPALVTAGCIEAFISPSHFPGLVQGCAWPDAGHFVLALLLLTGKATSGRDGESSSVPINGIIVADATGLRVPTRTSTTSKSATRAGRSFPWAGRSRA